jgi:hypothetical protein
MNDTGPATNEPPADPGHGKWLDRGFLLAVVLACAVVVSPNVAEPDLWGHVQYGRDVLEDGGISATTTYTFSVTNYRWINHENLSELIFAIGAMSVGGVGLMIMKCLLGVAVIVLILRHARRQGAQLVTMAILAMLVAVNLSYHWSVRPQIFTFVFYAVALALLSWVFAPWESHWNLPWLKRMTRADADRSPDWSSRRLRWLWLAPPLFFVWANTHGGFVAGYCIFTTILVCRGIEAVATRGWQVAGSMRRLAMIVVACGLATLINPYGPGLHAWLLGSLTQPRPEILDWHSIALTSPHFWPFVILIAVTVTSLLVSRKSLDFTHLVLLGLTLWQALEHQRHIPFFAVAAGFWLPGHVESSLGRWRKSADNSLTASLTPNMRRMVAVGLLCTYALLGYRLYDRLRVLRVERDKFPVAAVQYMVDRDLHGRLVVTYNWAQYAIAALKPYAPEPGVQVAFDGRFRTCYPQEVVDMHFDFILGAGDGVPRHRSENSPPADGGRVLRHGRPTLVLIDRALPHSLAVMRHHDDRWVLLYQDPVAEVWGLAARFDDPAGNDYIAPHERIIRSTLPGEDVPWPALPVRRAPPLALATHEDKPNHRNSCTSLLPQGASINNLLSVGSTNKQNEAVP